MNQNDYISENFSEEAIKAFDEFRVLCDKYPHIKFIGNSTFNIWMIDKKYRNKEGFLLGGNPVLLDGDSNYFLYKNVWNNKKPKKSIFNWLKI